MSLAETDNKDKVNFPPTDNGDLINIWMFYNKYNETPVDSVAPVNMISFKEIDTYEGPQLIIGEIIGQYNFFPDKKRYYTVKSQGQYLVIQENDCLNMDEPTISQYIKNLYKNNEFLEELKFHVNYLFAVTPMEIPESQLEEMGMYTAMNSKKPEDAYKRIKKRFFKAINLYQNVVFPIGQYVYDKK